LSYHEGADQEVIHGNKNMGACIVSYPAICHGEPTFRGTCIMVADVLEPVESGMAYEAIIEVAFRDRQATRLPKQSAIAREAPGLVQ